ncbi:c-type cytochrome [Sphingosinicella xenopeptidilytica]|uniref:C-type cytochrome n=1 Tax=Sphingosinicella xenopeptidilytica TaxID=364098 RepID=A0ABW3C7Z2_SPHXN
MLRIAAAMLLMALPAAAEAADGPALYKRCAACHLATGAGVPGAFPSLKVEPAALAAKPDGRRFLVLALTRGLSGPLVVDGKTYRGVMPAQPMKDDEVAAVLNHVLDTIAAADKKVTRFSADEVGGIRKGGAALTPRQVAELKAAIK